MAGEIISERWARSSRNGGRLHSGIASGFTPESADGAVKSCNHQRKEFKGLALLKQSLRIIEAVSCSVLQLHATTAIAEKSHAKRVAVASDGAHSVSKSALGEARLLHRCGLFSAGFRRTELREFLAGSVFLNHSYALEFRRDRGALLLVLFRLWFFLLAIASQLALCHLALPSLAVDAA
jgi:hypothetical protein